MSFFSTLCNQIPVVGYVKGAIHDIVGDSEGAKQAFQQCTRSTAVIAGGITGGPLGAVGAGIAVDALMSIGTREPHGVIRGIDKMADDIDRGKFPVMSTIETVLTPACDALGGQAAGKVLQSVTVTAGKKMTIKVAAKAADIALTAAPGLCEAMLESNKNSNRGRLYSPKPRATPPKATPPRAKQQPKATPPPGNNSNKSSSTGPSRDPPKRDPDPPKGNSNAKNTKTDIAAIVREILELLKKIFPGITEHEMNRLRLLINTIIKNGYDMRIIVIAISMYKHLRIDGDDVMIFSSLTEFLMVFIQEQIFEYSESSEYVFNFEELLEIILQNIMNSTYIPQSLIKLFEKFFNIKSVKHKYGEPPNFDFIIEIVNQLLERIVAEPTHLRFGDIFSALYHYYKHRKIVCKYSGRVDHLTVAEYFKVIEIVYSEIIDTDQYYEMKRTQRGVATYSVYQIIHISHYTLHGRHFKLVIKLQNGRIVVASCFYIEFI